MFQPQMSVQDDIKAYLEEKDLKNLFVTIVEAILIEKPESPVSFIASYLKEKYPSDVDAILKDNFKKLTDQVSHELDATPAVSDESDSSESESDTEAESKPLPLNINKQPSKRRSSICAEKLCPTKVQNEIKVIKKSPLELERIGEILKKCVLFEHLDEVQMESVQGAMFPVEKSDSDIIIQQGDDGDNFYIIESGCVDVFIESKDGSKLVNSFSNGDSFGELAIMYNAPRAATCIATNGIVKMWALDRSSFKLILMKTAIDKRNQYRSFLEKVPILSQLTEHEILTIADVLHEESFKENTEICSEGESGDRFYIIKEGSVVCTKTVTNNDDKSSVKEVATLTSGAYFGEIALLTSKRRQATVRAATPLKCVSLDRKTFKRVMGPLQEILMRNIDEYNQFQASKI